MLRLLFLFLRQRLHVGRPEPAGRVGCRAHARRTPLWVGALALVLGAAAYTLPGWRAAQRDAQPRDAQPPAPAEKATLRLRVAGIESPPLLVYLDRPGSDAAATPAAATPTVQLNSVDSVFAPAFQVAPLAARIELGNADAVAHNTHLFDGRRRTLFNVALPQQGVPVTRVLSRGGLFEVRCDLHTWMRAAVFVPPNGHHVLVRKAGEVVLRDITPGRWQVHVWTPAHGESVQAIELGPGAAETLDVTAR